MNVCQFLVIHPTRYKWEQIVQEPGKSQRYGPHQYQVEMAYNPIAVMGQKVQRNCGIDNTSCSRCKEHDYTPDTKHHRRCKLDSSAPHGCYKVKDMHCRWRNCCQRANHKYGLFRKTHTRGEHVVSPRTKSDDYDYHQR